MNAPHSPQTSPGPSALAALHSSACGVDTESFGFDRALMAHTTVCLQWGTIEGLSSIRHNVEPTKRVRDAAAWTFSREHEQIWLHNGPFDLACLLEWYPEHRDLIWQALQEGRVLDTMYLQRLIQIARGEIGGPLALDKVCLQYGVAPPTKLIEATHPSFPGETFDVRTSFGLWYNADTIPEPWYGYADYDGVGTLSLAARQVERHCTPARPGAQVLVRLQDLAEVCRTYFGLNLARTYGLRVNQRAVSDLAAAARGAMRRLQDAARINGFLKPVPAMRTEAAAGHTAGAFCSVRYESRPAQAAKQPAWDRRAAKHAGCPGCRQHATEAAVARRKTILRARKEAKLAEVTWDPSVVPPLPAGAPKVPAWSKDTKVLKAAVVEAYEGKPPLTEPKKDKKTGKMTGGGAVAISRHVLQDSGNQELEAWSEYNEWGALMSKDMPIFARGIVHSRISITNNLRPAASDPNILNFRRNSFYVAKCAAPGCEYEMTMDKDDLPKKGTALLCPVCQK